MEFLPQWIGVVAFVWTVLLYRGSLKDKRAEQARQVSFFPLEPELLQPGHALEFDSESNSSVGTRVRTVWEGEGDARRRVAVARIYVRPIEVVNRSREVISELLVMMGPRDASFGVGTTASTIYLPPGEKTTFTLFREYEDGDWFTEGPQLGVWFTFADNVGQRWMKTIGGELRPVSGQTVMPNIGRISRIRSWLRGKPT